MSDPDTRRRVRDPVDHENVVANYKALGYRVRGETNPEGTTRLVETGRGGIVAHLLLFLTTFGIGNLVYAWHKGRQNESVEVRTVGVGDGYADAAAGRYTER